MPYVPGAVVHGVTHVADVYNSPNVWANNVPIALWQEAGASAAFASISIAAPAELLTEAVTIIETQTNNYVANPASFDNPEAAANGVKQYYAPVTVEVSTGTVAPSAAPSGTDIIPFLNSMLEEAGRGMWRESGQGGKASNKNIVGIWTELGFPSGSPWNTDQTAWCMGFVNWVLKKTGYRWAQEARTVGIKNNPSRWGATEVPIGSAQPGDIVLWNFSHVAFVYAKSGDKLSFCGGNQTPKSGKNNNPDDGDITISWGGADGSTPVWTSNRGGITAIYRPSKS